MSGYPETTDLIGRRFGRLVVKKFMGTKNGRGFWSVVCDCGTEKTVSRSTLISGHTLSCGCFMLERAKECNSLPNGVAHINGLFKTYADSAKNRCLSFELTKEEFVSLISKSCFYCNEPPSERWHEARGNGHMLSNGLDRIDSSKGYTTNNVVPCCKECNNKKKYLTPVELLLEEEKND